MSVTGSVPTIVARAVSPLLKFTVMVPPLPATAATWLLVRMSPSCDRMMPEPEPDSVELLTLIFTTEGSTAAATCSTLPLAGALGALTALSAVVELAEVVDWELSPCQASYQAAPPTPAEPPIRRAPVSTAAVKAPDRRAGAVAAGGVG